MQIINSTIKRNGIKLLANFLMDHHKEPMQALERISVWSTKLEMQIDQGEDSAHLELSKHYSTDGNPQTISIKKDCFEIEIVEAEEFI